MTRFGYVMVTYFSIMGVAIASFIPTPTRLLWNVSASAPIGLYAIDPPGDIAVTDLVAVDPPEPLADFMVERGYIGRGVPLLKRVMGLPGQEVCRIRRTITVDGVELGAALDRDRSGRELPVWNGCRRIGGDEIFLMNPDVRDSLDGRYFGPDPGQVRHRPRDADLHRRGRRWPLRLARRAALTATIPAGMTLAGFHPTPSIEEIPMPQIGQFTRETTGFVGRIQYAHPLAANSPSFRPSRPMPRTRRTIASTTAPDDGPEIGAGWKRTGERAGEYISLLIDDPALPQPIRANLFRDDDGGAAWSLHWTRPVKRGERE